MATRYNIQLDEVHATKLEALAARAHVQAGPLARSLLSTAIDETDPDAETIVEILDAIPGAFERHRQGLDDVREGRSSALDEL